MTVGQLIKKLSELNQDVEVVSHREVRFSSWTTGNEEVSLSEVYDYETRVVLEFE